MSDTNVPTKTPAAFRPGVVLALILAAVFSLSAMGVLGAYAPDLADGDDGRDHALSRSAIGYGGVVRLLRAMDRPVVLGRGGMGGGGADSLLVLTPPPGREQAAMDRLLAANTAALIVLPKWQAAADPMRRGWVRRLGTLRPAESLAVLPADIVGLEVSVAQGRQRLRLQDARGREIAGAATVEDPRFLSGAGFTPVVLDAAGRALVVEHDDTGILILGDPDLLNTRDLNDPAKAQAALGLLETLRPTELGVVFDVSLQGFARPRSVMRLLLEPPLLGFTLCLAFAAGLVAWQAMVRFAPHAHIRRAVALGKKALADNTAALVRLARREHHMAKPYAELVRAQAAKAVAAPPHLSDEALTALLDRLAQRQGVETSFAALAEEAARARNPGDLMMVARALNRWKSEMTRGRG